MWWILFALLSLSASLIVWLACVASGRMEETADVLPLYTTDALLPVAGRVPGAGD